MLNSHSIRLIWSALLASAAEQIDGFYIGYRTLSSGSIESIDITGTGKAVDQLSGKQSSSIPAYTFKTMYDLARIAMANGSNNDNNNNNDPNNSILTKSSNMTTFCEVITSEAQMGLSYHNKKMEQKAKFGPKSGGNKDSNGGGKREQIRCTYEFVVQSLSRKTRYG